MGDDSNSCFGDRWGAVATVASPTIVRSSLGDSLCCRLRTRGVYCLWLFLDISLPLLFVQIQSIFHDHGVVCIPREGKDVRKLTFENDVLYEYRVSFHGEDFFLSCVY